MIEEFKNFNLIIKKENIRFIWDGGYNG